MATIFPGFSHNERRLRGLLLDSNLKYSDTHWVRRSFVVKFTAAFPNDFKQIPVLMSDIPVKAQLRCAHPAVEETLVPGAPVNIAMSVVLTAMLNTTVDFNAFQIVVNSKKFDLNEALIFHRRKWNSTTNWIVEIMDPIGMAIILDKGTVIEDPRSFLLLKTLKLSSLSLEKELQAFEMKLALGLNTETAYRTKGTLSFLVSSLNANFLSESEPLLLQELLNALCSIGIIFTHHVAPSSTSYLFPIRLNEYCYHYYRNEGSSLLATLFEIFEFFYITDTTGIEYFVALWILCGWIGIERETTAIH